MILYIYCAGGFGKEIMDVARRQNAATQRWSAIKFVDDVLVDKVKYATEVLTFQDIVDSDSLGSANFVIANGEPTIRCKIYKKLQDFGAKLGVVVDVSTLVSATAVLEDGVVITPLCSISSDAFLAKNSCVNTMTIIGHDVQIGQNSVISSMVNRGGACVVGEGTYIGMGALIKEGIRIGSNSIVGMGSVVYSDIPDNVIALGNPARVMRSNIDQKVFK